jgi:hypothetical protein
VAKLSTSASNNKGNSGLGLAQGTLTCCTPCCGQRTRGARSMQERLCWEKVQMPPRPLRGVMQRVATVDTVPGRAGEARATLEVQVQVQLGGLSVELAARHPPRPAHPQRRREQKQRGTCRAGRTRQRLISPRGQAVAGGRGGDLMPQCSAQTSCRSPRWL